jgi:hypothetical protein
VFDAAASAAGFATSNAGRGVVGVIPQRASRADFAPRPG